MRHHETTCQAAKIKQYTTCCNDDLQHSHIHRSQGDHQIGWIAELKKRHIHKMLLAGIMPATLSLYVPMLTIREAIQSGILDEKAAVFIAVRTSKQAGILLTSLQGRYAYAGMGGRAADTLQGRTGGL